MIVCKVLLGLTMLALIAGCGSPSVEQSRVHATPSDNPRLTARMSDGDILCQLGYDPTQLKAHKVQGPDGYATEYNARHGEWVSILRSASTGVFVMSGDSKGRKRSWELGL